MDTRAFDIGMIGQVMPALLSYLDVTLLVAGVSIVLGSVLGGLLAWTSLAGGRVLRYLAAGYVYVMRCTPSIVLLFIVFYGLPKLIEGVFHYNINDMHRAVFAIIAFSAYMVLCPPTLTAQDSISPVLSDAQTAESASQQ